MTVLQTTTFVAGDKIITLCPQIGQFSFARNASSATRDFFFLGPGEVATSLPRTDIGSEFIEIVITDVSNPEDFNISGVPQTGSVSRTRDAYLETYPDANGDFQTNTVRSALLPNTVGAVVGYKWKVTYLTFSQRYNFSFTVSTAFLSSGSIANGKVLKQIGVHSDGSPTVAIMNGATDALALGIALEDCFGGHFAYMSLAGHMPYGFVSGATLNAPLYVTTVGDLTLSSGTFQIGNIDSLSTGITRVGIMHKF
jgi:hypothetical protein